MKRINTRIIKSKYSYQVQELADLIGAHPHTIHNWINKEGLVKIDDAYPHLLYGLEVINFIKSRQNKNKVILKLEEFYCCKCRRARHTKIGQEKLLPHTSKVAHLKGKCDVCNTSIGKLISLKKLYLFKEIFDFQTLEFEALVQSENNSVNCETKGV